MNSSGLFFHSSISFSVIARSLATLESKVSFPIRRRGVGDKNQIMMRRFLSAVAWKIRKRTSMRHKWIAERLSMGTAANVSQQVRKFECVSARSFTPVLRRWKKS